MAYKVPGDAQGRALDCDLIMKGGVTSGLVYPGAITALAQQYRLRNIGGTSAGAIAAVAAAAMEYGLQTGKRADIEKNDPRTVLANLPTNILAQPTQQGSTRLAAMFSGDPGTAALLDAIKAALAGDWKALIALLGAVWQSAGPRNRRALANTGWATGLQGLAGGAFAGLLGSLFPSGAAMAASAALLGTAGSVIGAALLNWQGLKLTLSLTREDANNLLQPVIDNGIGLSTGMTAPPHTISGKQVPALTPWLHETIQSLAGLSPDEPGDVLTFGKLWTLSSVDKPSSLDPRAIDLVLVCTDLNRMQSGSFPFLPDNHRLFFDPVAWRRLFPDPVVKAVEASAYDIAGLKKAINGKASKLKMDYTAKDVDDALGPHGDLGARLRLLPMGRDIPILIAARASMAFPGLFTPVPMWLLRFSGDPEQAGQRTAMLSRVYLSDGGLTSNFPIHLFDGVVPGRPTFAINLLYPGDDLAVEEYAQQRAPDSEAAKVAPSNVRNFTGDKAGDGQATPDPQHILSRDLVMPFTNADQIKFYKPPAGGDALNQLLGLVGRIGETSRAWGDVQLYNQTGTRDRIIHIRLTGAEGGFNLNMSPTTIASIDTKGTTAGSVLSSRFQRDGATDLLRPGSRLQLDWLNHRTVRINSLLAAQDLLAARFHAGLQPHTPPTPQRDLPPPASLITSTQLHKVAHRLSIIGGRLPDGDNPYANVVTPLNLLRIRPADADPRSVRRTA